MSAIEVADLSMMFRTGGMFRRSAVHAVDDVTLRIEQGEVVGLVGESGSGKTTIGRMIVGLLEPTAGTITLDGEPLWRGGHRERLASRRAVQMVFQNTQGAFNPRRKVRSILSDPYVIHGMAQGLDITSRLETLFRSVGLDPAMLDKFPHQFSGGQRQRISIARALTLEPRFLVADEPTSALDVSVQAQILNLLSDLVRTSRMGMLFVSHDMRAVRHLCDRVIVLYRGRIVESGPTETIFSDARHPYTRALIDAVPALEIGSSRLSRLGTGESVAHAPTSTGCHYADRCLHRRQLGDPQQCIDERPLLLSTDAHEAACHFPENRGVDSQEAVR